jgi:hypothetical protein
MAADVPYMLSVTNLPSIIVKIRSAGTPPRFTHEFLKSNLGYGSSQDRAVIKLLKQLGFITADGTPTERYNAYKGADGRRALASGLREGWSGFFLSDERIYEKSKGHIQGVAKSVTGAGDSVATKMASTFKTLADLADFSGPAAGQGASEPGTSTDQATGQSDNLPAIPAAAVASVGGLLTLNHDIHLHLPSTSDVSVYRAIFQAIKSELM